MDDPLLEPLHGLAPGCVPTLAVAIVGKPVLDLFVHGRPVDPTFLYLLQESVGAREPSGRSDRRNRFEGIASHDLEGGQVVVQQRLGDPCRSSVVAHRVREDREITSSELRIQKRLEPLIVEVEFELGEGHATSIAARLDLLVASLPVCRIEASGLRDQFREHLVEVLGLRAGDEFGDDRGLDVLAKGAELLLQGRAGGECPRRVTVISCVGITLGRRRILADGREIPEGDGGTCGLDGRPDEQEAWHSHAARLRKIS